MEVLEAVVIPQSFPYPKMTWEKEIGLGVEVFMERQRWVDKGMFAFVCWDWVNPLAEFLKGKKVLEVMAGRGWLSYALREKGIALVSTDDFSWYSDGKGLKKWDDPITEIEKLDCLTAIKEYGKEVDYVIMSWAWMDGQAAGVLELLNRVNPNAKLIYIGEGEGGCTANDDFFEHFEEEEVSNDLFIEAIYKYRRWRGVNDYLALGKYKP